MATTAFASIFHDLRRQAQERLTDGELLERFIARRDEAAFEGLLRRHGPMVLGVCRRVLRNEVDAEDAFQAVFLVLVRKAISIRPRAMVGNWLYGVAHSTALKARAMSSKRFAKEREAATRRQPYSIADGSEGLHELLDQELKILPDKYRAAIVLCDLEGRSIKAAARQLGCPPGTVGTRLARGDDPPDALRKPDIIGAGEIAMELFKTTKDSNAKWMALRILGNLRYERAIPLLLESLTDPHDYVRSNAARALGDMRVAAAAKPLIKMLEKETNGGVIQQTAGALLHLHSADAIPALKVVANHEDGQTRMWVLQAIGGLGNKADVGFLARYLLNDPSSSVQTSAAQAIEQITGADFGFPKRSGPSSPDEGLKRAKAWWQEHKGEFGDR